MLHFKLYLVKKSTSSPNDLSSILLERVGCVLRQRIRFCSLESVCKENSGYFVCRKNEF